MAEVRLLPGIGRDLDAIADWVFTLCIVSGSERKTAYLVAAEFIKGLEREWAIRDLPPRPTRRKRVT